jgi:hypothetical protein
MVTDAEPCDNNSQSEIPSSAPNPKEEGPVKPPYRFDGEVPSALWRLRDKERWVAWDYRRKNGRWTKPPFDPRTGRNASVNVPATWATLGVARAGMERHGFAGIGLILNGDDDITGIDLDDCISDADSLSDVAAEIIGYAETYAEISPSGEGIRLFALGKVDNALTDEASGIEVYGAGRYLTVTGRHIEGTPTEIRQAPRTMATLRSIVEAARGANTPSRMAGCKPQVSTSLATSTLPHLAVSTTGCRRSIRPRASTPLALGASHPRT